MKIHSYGKKLMAVACAVVMLVSCMVFAPVSAEKAEIFKADFEATYPYCTKEGDSNRFKNVVKAGGNVYAKQAKDGSNGVMELYYGKASDVAAFRVLDAEGQVPQTVANTPYRISFRYKVVNMPTSMLLSFVPNTENYDSNVYNRFNGQSVHHKIVLDEDTPQGEWLNASFAWVPGSGGSYFNLGLTYVKVNGAVPEAIIGAKVLIDDVVIETMEDGDYLKVQHNYNYENAGFNNYQGCEGDALWKTPDARSGYHFDGWFTAAEGGEQVTTFTSAHTNIYAHWSQAVEVTFDVDGTTATRTLGVGNSITRTAPDKVHYAFKGWTTEKGNANTLVDTVTADMSTLYAYYEQTEYVITFDPKIGGTQEQVVSVADAAGTVVKFPTVSRAGYRLDGWNDGTTTLTGDALTGVPVTGDITYTAVWTKTGEVPEVDGLQSFENVSIEDLTYNTNRKLELTAEDNHTYAGDKSLKAHIQSGMNGQLARPRLVLGKVEAGKNYTVSFWAKTDKATGDFNFYLATYAGDTLEKKISTEGPWTSTINSDTHTLQSLTVVTVPSKATQSEQNGIANAGLSTYLPTKWAQYVVSFTATADKDSAENYLALGYTDSAAYTKDGHIYTTEDERDIYIDDIQIAESDTVDTNVFDYDDLETKKYDSGDTKHIFGTGTARYVSEDVPDHTFGNGGTGKVGKVVLQDITAFNEGTKAYITSLSKTDGGAYIIKEESNYLVSAWLYAKSDSAKQVGVRVGNSNNTDHENDHGTTLTTTTVNLKAGQWQKVSFLVHVPTKENANPYKYIYLAFWQDNRIEEGKLDSIYIDDVSVTELTDTTDTLDSFAGNAALYANGNNTAYSDGYGAMRFLGGYQTVDGDATKAVIGGVTYTVKQRGIILGSETQTGLTLTSESLKVSTATKGLENYWEMRNGNFVTFSLLIKNVSKTGIDTKYNFRPYVTVEVDGAEVTLYGKEVDGISWSDVFAAAKTQNPALDNSWTTAE